MKTTFLRAAAFTLLSVAGAAAATQDGNLNVSTTILVSCNAPSPSGTLRLPFNPRNDLVSQAMASTKVRVSISCRGNPTISSVGFDNGTYRDTSTTIEFPETRVRYMKSNDAAGDVPNHFLGYKLFASANPDLASANMADGEELGTSSSSNFDNKLSLSEGFDGTFFVTGKVFESSALRSAGMFSQIGSVPGGSYSDTVLMTVSYN